LSQFTEFVSRELPLRTVLLKGSVAVGDPRYSSDPLVNNAPLGTLYLRDDVSPKTTWQKQGGGPTQWVTISGNFGKIQVRRKFVLTYPAVAGEAIDLVTGNGNISATCTTSGSSVTIPADYLDNNSVEFHLNGIRMEKGEQVIHSGGSFSLNIPLDPGDRIIIQAEEDI